MKKNLQIILPAAGIIIIAAIIALFFRTTTAQVVRKNNAVTVNQKEEKPSCCSEEETEEYSESSLFQLEQNWVDQNGNKVDLGRFEGKNTVLTMFFASCTYACPILVQDMKKIESNIPKEDLDGYNFVLISIDPERDTPEALKAYAERNNLNTERWTLLTGTSDEVMEIAALLGFKYKKELNGDYSHSNLITILNEKGEVAHQHVGLNQDITPAAEILTSL